MDLTIIAGPLIGAVIGYFTNYLAVKMLFRPRREIKIGSKTLPFTPGVIPKGKPRLARVIGRTVADTLVTGEDIRKSLLSDSMQEAVADKAESILQSRLQTAVCRLTRWDDKEYETTKEKVCDKLSQEIYETVLQMPLQEKISESMLRYAQEKLAEMGGDGMMGGMIAMMLPPERLASIIEPAGEKMQKYVKDHGLEYIRQAHCRMQLQHLPPPVQIKVLWPLPDVLLSAASLHQGACHSSENTRQTPLQQHPAAP